MVWHHNPQKTYVICIPGSKTKKFVGLSSAPLNSANVRQMGVNVSKTYSWNNHLDEFLTQPLLYF